jgi:hypothetical protein
MPCSCYFCRPAGIFTSISLGLLLTSADYLGIPIRSNMYMVHWISAHEIHFKIKNARSIKLWPLIIFFSFDIRDFPGIFIMAHQHKILWTINSGWGSLRPLVGSRGNSGTRGVGKPPCRKWVSEFSDPFESLFLSHIIYYRVYLQVFIYKKWVIFPCINADSWEKDVQLHSVVEQNSTTKIFVTLSRVYFFFLFTLL